MRVSAYEQNEHFLASHVSEHLRSAERYESTDQKQKKEDTHKYRQRHSPFYCHNPRILPIGGLTQFLQIVALSTAEGLKHSHFHLRYLLNSSFAFHPSHTPRPIITGKNG